MTIETSPYQSPPLTELSVANEEIALVEAANSLLKLALRLRQEAIDTHQRVSIVRDWIDRNNLPLHWKMADKEEPHQFFLRTLQEVQGPKPNTFHDRSWRMLEDALYEVIKANSHSDRLAEAIQKQSEQAVYDFAYGLTHEINNPLANIAARAQQLLAKSNDPVDQKSIATIVDQAMRAHEMLAEMMQAVKPRSLETAVVNLSEITARAVKTCEKWSASRQVSIVANIHSPALYVVADATALCQTIVDLIRNALDACQSGDRIELTLQPLTSPSDPNLAQRDAPIHPSTTYVQLLVTDTGAGMDPDTLSRAKNLYFSGREHGRGLGISLAKVHRVIQSLHGSVEIASHPQTGTIVEIRLPRSNPPPTKPLLGIRL